jgi:predicted nucleic acid-binding protein
MEQYLGRGQTFMSDNLAYQFVDTNVLVCAHDQTGGEKQTQAKTLIQELWTSGIGCLSVQVLQEFYVTVTQKVRQPLLAGIAANVVEDLSFWRVYAPNAKDVLSAIDLQQRYGLSFWEAMIIHSAGQLQCQVIWSEDLNSGQNYGGVRVVNPFVEYRTAN